MEIWEYFNDKLRTVGKYKLRKLGVIDELRVLDYYKKVINSNEDLQQVIEALDSIVHICVVNQNEIDSEKDIESLFEVIQENIIGNIAAAATDDDLAFYFKQQDSDSEQDTDEQPTNIRLSDYILYCITEFGYQSIHYLSISELYILRRFQGKEYYRQRMDNVLDVRAAYHTDKKGINEYINSITAYIKDSHKEDQSNEYSESGLKEIEEIRQLSEKQLMERARKEMKEMINNREKEGNDKNKAE